MAAAKRSKRAEKLAADRKKQLAKAHELIEQCTYDADIFPALPHSGRADNRGENE